MSARQGSSIISRAQHPDDIVMPSVIFPLPRHSGVAQLTIALIRLHHLGIVIVVDLAFVDGGSIACGLREPVG